MSILMYWVCLLRSMFLTGPKINFGHLLSPTHRSDLSYLIINLSVYVCTGVLVCHAGTAISHSSWVWSSSPSCLSRFGWSAFRMSGASSRLFDLDSISYARRADRDRTDTWICLFCGAGWQSVSSSIAEPRILEELVLGYTPGSSWSTGVAAWLGSGRTLPHQASCQRHSLQPLMRQACGPLVNSRRDGDADATPSARQR